MRRFDERRPAVVTAIGHALCSQSGAAFLLTCLAQRAGEVDVSFEVQHLGRKDEVGDAWHEVRRKKFREFLAEFDEPPQLGYVWGMLGMKYQSLASFSI